MKKRYKSGFVVSALAAAALLVGTQASADITGHPTISLKTSAGLAVGQHDAYSPKMTCAGCHFDCETGASTTDSTQYCGSELNADGTGGTVAALNNQQINCTATGACPDYGMGTHVSIHTQGVQADVGDGVEVYWQANEVTSYEHGAMASRHANAGRNEDYSAEHREARHDGFFTNSPGMFGKW